MAHKLALVFAVLTLASIANAAVTTGSPSGTTFNSTPVTVINSTDTVFYNKILASDTAFGPGSDNTTFYLYGYVTPTAVSSVYTYSVIRRKFNATTQAQVGSDETLSGASCDTSADDIKVGGGGASAIACALSASDIQNVWVYSWTATATTAKATQISNEAATTNKYAVEDLFYDAGAMMWYVVYRQTDGTNLLKILIQAVNVSNGTAAVVYTAPGVSVFTPTGTIATGNFPTVSGGLNNVTNATTASLIFKDASVDPMVVKLLPVTLSTGAAGSVVALATDATTDKVDDTTAGHTVTNTPAGLGCSYSTYLAGVYQNEYNVPAAAASTTIATTRKLWIYYNGSSTSGENYTVANTADDTGASIVGTQFGNGYTIFQIIPTAGTGNLVSRAVQFINYFGNGSYNASSTATAVGTYQGSTSMWLDANGALWVGTVNYEADATDTVTLDMVADASVGKLFGQVYLFANTLSSVFAFVALMVAALFAF